MLGVTLQINDRVIAFYEIRRVAPVGVAPLPSTICRYRVFDEEGNQVLADEVQHRFSSGATALAYKVLGKIERVRKNIVRKSTPPVAGLVGQTDLFGV